MLEPLVVYVALDSAEWIIGDPTKKLLPTLVAPTFKMTNTVTATLR